MEAFIIIIKGFILGWLLANFEPIQEPLKLLKNKISDRYFIVFYLKTAVSCHKCLAFWSTLILSGGNIYLAGASAIMAYTYDKIQNRL